MQMKTKIVCMILNHKERVGKVFYDCFGVQSTSDTSRNGLEDCSGSCCCSLCEVIYLHTQHHITSSKRIAEVNRASVFSDFVSNSSVFVKTFCPLFMHKYCRLRNRQNFNAF